ncbi:MAG: thiamine pyrophosphate-requiring protein [Rhodospirillaceae bacterium]|nr:thiamine pyrophosphate-requiring protein [Rhodospirillaceae bacterium]
MSGPPRRAGPAGVAAGAPVTGGAAGGGTVAGRLLARLGRHVDYIFANTGTDFPPIIEARAGGAAEGARLPRAIAVPHENVAVAMACGHTMVSGRPQAVMVHVNVGTANALCGLLNAARGRIPMLLAAGRTPYHETGPHGARSRTIQWAQEMFDQAGLVREAVKWDYELSRGEQVEAAVDRAFAIALSEPMGPVYLTLPREVLAEPGAGGESPAARSSAPARPPGPDPAAIEEAAQILAAAERPLIIAGDAGRSAAAFEALARLAERHAIPVVGFAARSLCIAAGHPMNLGYEPGPLLAEADAVLTVDCDVPWIPSLQGPPAGCRVVHLGVDPLFVRYPIRTFPCDLAIDASPALALPALDAALAEQAADPGRVAARRSALAARAGELRAGWRRAAEEAAGARPIAIPWLSHCIDRIADDDSIVLNELGLSPAQLTLRRPGSYFGLSPTGGLGWGLGAALGAKLAAPDRLVIAAVGDGAYMFGNPTPAHYVSRAHGLPVLYVVSNNAGWGAVRAATKAMYPDGAAAQRNAMPLAALGPMPDFETVITASGGYGERVEDPAALPDALDRAVRAVREEGRQALLNVITADR